MNDMRPLVAAKINGADAQLIADSGAFFSSLTPTAARELNLNAGVTPFDLDVRGVGGSSRGTVVTVREFALDTVPPMKPVPHANFVVTGNDIGHGVAGVLGQNLLGFADVEYDLAHGVIRLLSPRGCGQAPLAYWAKDQPYSEISIEFPTREHPHTVGSARVNEASIRVMFDTGAATSVLSLRAAAWAGVRPSSAGVVPAGNAYGVGPTPVPTWIAPFASFSLGQEEIHATRLRIGDIQLAGDMLVGADFFLSHRVYVANSQRKLYFTYNGGPVFDLTSHAPAPGTAAQEMQPPLPPDEPTDASGFSRRGAAFAARRDYAHAIADLTRACELDPTQAAYFYERGVARLNDHQPELALTDFDQALKLRPEDLPARVARAELHLARSEPAAAAADLEAASRAAPTADGVHLQLGALYVRAAQFAEAITQYDQWLESHDGDVHRPEALAGRCRARAMLGRDLEKALSDCNAAVGARGDEPVFHAARGLAELRLGKADPAIADFDRVLAAQPRNALCLYGRGVARLRKGQAPRGQEDIEAATALNPALVNVLSNHGIKP